MGYINLGNTTIDLSEIQYVKINSASGSEKDYEAAITIRFKDGHELKKTYADAKQGTQHFDELNKRLGVDDPSSNQKNSKQ